MIIFFRKTTIMANEPETNFLKIILLLMRYGSTVLQHRIEYELRIRKWQTVTDFLKERKHDILHLTLDKNRKCCIKNCKIQTASKRLINTRLLELMYEDVKRSCLARFIHCCSCNFTPKSDLDISVWDITLTSCLLFWSWTETSNSQFTKSTEQQGTTTQRKRWNEWCRIRRSVGELDK